MVAWWRGVIALPNTCIKARGGVVALCYSITQYLHQGVKWGNDIMYQKNIVFDASRILGGGGIYARAGGRVTRCSNSKSKISTFLVTL